MASERQTTRNEYHPSRVGIRLSDGAEADLDHIHSYISKRNQPAANRIVDALLSTAYHLAEFPFLGGS